jgi:hypothetical protein
VALVAASLAGCASPLDTQVTTTEPQQLEVEQRAPFRIERSGATWELVPRAEYRIQAKLLSVRRYRSGWQSDLAPCDLAIGWGELIERGLDREVDWSQSDRWYHWSYGRGFAENNRFVAQHSANVHVIPANELVAEQLCDLSAGDAVALEGLLVDARGGSAQAPRWWHTSLSRTDRGDGSCELMWVERVASH